MTIHVADCPRCKSKHTTFDVLTACCTSSLTDRFAKFFNIEIPVQCRHCGHVSIIRGQIYDSDLAENIARAIEGYPRLNDCVSNALGFVSLADVDTDAAPQYLPQNIEAIYTEGSKCFAIGCYNAAGAMFRLCLDIATKSLLQEVDTHTMNHNQRSKLAFRLDWIFDNKYWADDLRELASCIKNNGNDGAHDGDLDAVDAEDLKDFTHLILERVYTIPARNKMALGRREERKKKKYGN